MRAHRIDEGRVTARVVVEHHEARGLATAATLESSSKGCVSRTPLAIPSSACTPTVACQAAIGGGLPASRTESRSSVTPGTLKVASTHKVDESAAGARPPLQTV